MMSGTNYRKDVSQIGAADGTRETNQKKLCIVGSVTDDLYCMDVGYVYVLSMQRAV